MSVLLHRRKAFRGGAMAKGWLASDVSATGNTAAADDVFASVTFGAADADRRLWLALAWRSGSPPCVPDKVELASVSMGSALVSVETATIGFGVAIYQLLVTSGTTGEVRYSFDQNTDWSAWSLWRTVGASATPHATASGTTASTTINVANDGYLVGMSSSALATGPSTLTGFDAPEDANEVIGGVDDHSTAASFDATSSETGRTVFIDGGHGTYDAYSVVSITP